MRQSWMIGLCTMLLAGVAGPKERTERTAWKTYRNERFGYDSPSEIWSAVGRRWGERERLADREAPANACGF